MWHPAAMTLPAWLLLALASYLVGSVPVGYLVGRLRGVDIRRAGSGNIGATNVFRVIGKPWGVLVFLIDFLKGLAPVLAANALPAALPDAAAPGALPGLVAGLAAILGHNHPVWLGFRGGKGVATSAGALVGIMPLVVLCAMLVWLAVFLPTRLVSLASILAALSLPLLYAGVTRWLGGFDPLALTLAVVIAVLAVWRHRSNIARLRAGTEHRMGGGPARPASHEDSP